MTEMTEYKPGTFSWIDLATTDADGAKKFYQKLFGWSTTDNPAGPDMVYTMAELGGKPVAALYQQGAEQQSQGIPPHWLSYVTVANAAETAEKAKSLGGNVLMDAFDVMEAGRMALIQDPTGATFAIWQPQQHIGAHLVNEYGALIWNELATTDKNVATDFYTKLFGWSSQTQEMPSGPYTSFMNGESMAAGMLEMTEEWGNIPPHWMVYFGTDDCDATVATAKELGGTILVDPTDIPSVGRFAVLQDPQGAAFSVITLPNPD
jgi:predicted enzyme related to lactoylglutathione lyase